MNDPALTVSDALRRLMAERMPSEGEVSPRDTRLLLAHAMGIDPGRLTLMVRDAVSPEVFDAARHLCRQRSAGIPVSHLRGYRDFYGRRFTVTADVLDPRPETETLIATALETAFGTVLDLGTGSGCILTTLLAERPEAKGIGTDLSTKALKIAASNAVRLGVSPRAEFVESNWFDAVKGRFDLIVSNPPYIALSEMESLSAEVLHEPRMALTDEADGLTAYRALAQGAPGHLEPGGWLMVEIGLTLGEAVADLFRAAGLSDVEIRADLDGRDRVVMARRGV